jgi:hypothetical protein
MNPAENIEARIAELKDWRGKTYRQLRDIVNNSDPEIVEEWKWHTAVWTYGKLVCAVSAHKKHVKINFFRGKQIQDPKNLFNNGFTSKEHRAIDFYEDDTVNATELKKLVQSAILLAKQ